MAIYEKSTRELMFMMVDEMGIRKGERIQREQVVNWFRERYPKIRVEVVNSHLTRMSTNAESRVSHYRRTLRDDLFYQVGRGEWELYDAARHPRPIVPGGYEDVCEVEDEVVAETARRAESSEFAYEKDLQHFLARHLAVIEDGMVLYEDEEAKGIEYPAGGRLIDLLAVDREGGLVVVELKVSKGYDRVVGQLLRYMNWVRRFVAEEGQRVRGMIVARHITEDLQLACAGLADVSLLEYEMSVKLQRVMT
ncbi:endonuclease NucS domain-containing protein [Poriferisphaera sp. WC338]|uniref:endonuclease NucS domain-containing protein n=1 Tax=Poriferisphaera sp. WC338 TaxID=3425129 RepID=UPI003D8138C4